MSISPARCADWPTGRHDRRFRVRFPGPYHYAPGRDGVDETFDVYCLTSEQHLCSFYYWFERQRAELEARLITVALNLPLLGEIYPCGITPDEISAFCQRYAGPYVSRRSHCEYRGPGYEVADRSGDDPVVFVPGRNRQTRLVTRQIASALNRLYVACLVTQPHVNSI
jgi:hypothetical protein